jgi:DNA-directed RNA polymerase subunit M/transcription elongation factor TFIIS
MKFCPVCENFLYIGLSVKDSNQLKYYCRHCGHDDNTPSDDIVVTSTQIKKSGEQNFQHMVNKYTKLDPTLPRIRNIHCPNEQCKTNRGSSDSVAAGTTEVIYIRYDDENLKYLYLCTECDTCWKTDSA